MSHLHHKVSALIDGELQGAARRRALAHARSCELCQRELEQTYALKQRLLGLAAAEPPADLFAALGSVRTVPFDAPDAASRTAFGRRALVGAGGLSVALVTLAYAVGGAEPTGAPVSPPVTEFSAEFAGSTGLEPLSDPAVEALSSTATGRNTPLGAAMTQPVNDLPADASGDDPRAVHALARAAGAPASVAYAGVRHVAWAGTSGESQITLAVQHTPRQGTSYAVLGGAGDGGDASATFLARSEASSTGALGSDEPVDLLVDAYDVSIAGGDTVDGRAATVVVAGQDGQTAARFWIDDATGLLLRRELYDGGRLIRVSELSDLDMSSSVFMKHLPPEFEAPVGTQLPTDFAPSLNDDGWACPPKLPHDYQLTFLHRLQGTRDVMHAAYSDGLSTVSVFEERGVLDTTALGSFEQVTAANSSVWLQEGLPTVVVWQAEGTIYTLVTDATPSATAELVASLPHQSDDVPGGNRLGRGLVKIGSSVVPGD